MTTKSSSIPEATADWQNVDASKSTMASCVPCGGGDREYTWEELQALEKKRRSILERVELPFWRVLLFWDGTCLKVMVRDILLWSNLCIYIFIRMQARRGNMPADLEMLEDINIDIIGGFLSFFLVLFVNQAQARFNVMYKQTCACKARITDVACTAGSYFPKANANRIVRYVNAAHAMGYVGLASDVYSMHSFFLPINKELKLLTNEEFERVRELETAAKGAAFKEILIWAIKDVKTMEDAQVINFDQRLWLSDRP